MSVAGCTTYRQACLVARSDWQPQRSSLAQAWPEQPQPQRRDPRPGPLGLPPPVAEIIPGKILEPPHA